MDWFDFLLQVVLNSWTFWLLTSPLGVGILSFVVVRYFYERDQQKQKKRCPRCDEEIRRAAMVCRFCGYQYTAKDDLRIVMSQERERGTRSWSTSPPYFEQRRMVGRLPT